MRGIAGGCRCTIVALSLVAPGCSLAFTFLAGDDGAPDAGADGDADGDTDADGDADADTDADGDLDAGPVGDAGPECPAADPPPATRPDSCDGPNVVTVEEPGGPDGSSTALPITVAPGQALLLRGGIEEGGDDDWWQIGLLQGQMLTLFADAGSIVIDEDGDADELMAWVYEREADAAGANLAGNSCNRDLGACPVACSDELSTEALAVQAARDAGYFIRVAHDDAEATTPYVLCVTLPE